MFVITRYKTRNFKSVYSREGSYATSSFITCELELKEPSWITFHNGSDRGEVVVKEDVDIAPFLEEGIDPSEPYLEIFNLSHFDKRTLKDSVGVCGYPYQFEEFERNSPYCYTRHYGLMHRVWLSNDAFNQLLSEINLGNSPSEILFYFNDVYFSVLSKIALRMSKMRMNGGLSFSNNNGKLLKRVSIESFRLENKCERKDFAPTHPVLVYMEHIKLMLIVVIVLLGLNLFF